MRTNNISPAFKIIIFAVTAIIVGVVCMIAIKTTNEGKAMVNSGTTQIKEMAESYSNIDLSSYDNTNLIGGALVDLIEEVVEEGKSLCIRVRTKSNIAAGDTAFTDYNKAFNGTNALTGAAGVLATQKNVTDNGYINPNAQFTGKVCKDDNKNIIAIVFTQMD